MDKVRKRETGRYAGEAEPCEVEEDEDDSGTAETAEGASQSCLSLHCSGRAQFPIRSRNKRKPGKLVDNAANSTEGTPENHERVAEETREREKGGGETLAGARGIVSQRQAKLSYVGTYTAKRAAKLNSECLAEEELK